MERIDEVDSLFWAVTAFLSKKDQLLGKEVSASLVHEKLIAMGKETYEESLRKKKSPDHCYSPHAFGYALRHGAITTKGVRFEQGENAEQFIVMADGLLEYLTARPLAPLPLKQSETRRKDECSCEGCLRLLGTK